MTLTFNRTGTIARQLNQADGANIITIFNAADLTNIPLQATQILSVNSFIKNLRCVAIINSLEETRLPIFDVAESDTEMLYKSLDVEWHSQRKQLDFYISNNQSSWIKTYSISLLNPKGYPYRAYNILDLFTDNIALEIGQNGRLGVAVQNVGWGLLQEQDSVVIHGTFTQEILHKPLDQAAIIGCTSFRIDCTTDTKILDANPSRKMLLITNEGMSKVFLNFGIPSGTNGIPLAANGGIYEYGVGGMPLMPLPIYASAITGSSSLSILECI